MKYMGGKAKIANDIIDIILKNRFDEQLYWEPFVGGCNLIDKISGKRMASDNNVYLIEMWKKLSDCHNDLPKLIDKQLYNEARDNYNGKINTMPIYLIGWIGFMASFNGRFFDGGYSGITDKRNYIDEQIRNTLKQVDQIKDIKFLYGTYYEISKKLTEPTLIYCDPPYKNTKQYSTSKNFDHDYFWEWCRNMNEQGHTVYISEYSAPDDFVCVWQKEITNSMATKNTYKPIEKLFIYGK